MLNKVKAIGRLIGLRQLELRFSLSTGTPCAFQGIIFTRPYAGRTAGVVVDLAQPAWAPLVCAGQLKLLDSVSQAECESSKPGIRDHKAHSGMTRPGAAAVRQFSHWPCHTHSWTRSLTGLVGIHQIGSLKAVLVKA